jgi:hypothetical protein
MQKLSNFTQHRWDRIAPASLGGGISRMPPDMASTMRRPQPSPSIGPSPNAEASTVNLSFNIPFSYGLAGPDPEDILHASPGASPRWTFPANTPEGTLTHKLPVHAQNEERLRTLCQYLSDQTGGRIHASVTSTEPTTGPALHRKSQSLVTNVCVSGDGDLVYKMRARILNETPIMMVPGALLPPFGCL